MHHFRTSIATLALAAMTATSAAAQSDEASGRFCDQNPGLCALGFPVVVLLLGLAASSGGGSSSSNCPGALIPAPEGGLMPANPDCR